MNLRPFPCQQNTGNRCARGRSPRSAPTVDAEGKRSLDVHQSDDGLIWHNHYRLDRTLSILRWQAEILGRLLGVPVAPLVCVHGAHIQHGGLRAHGVAIVPVALLRSALGHDQVLSDTDIELLAATARTSLRPAA